jgi:hypothetical protein
MPLSGSVLDRLGPTLWLAAGNTEKSVNCPFIGDIRFLNK